MPFHMLLVAVVAQRSRRPRNRPMLFLPLHTPAPTRAPCPFDTTHHQRVYQCYCVCGVQVLGNATRGNRVVPELQLWQQVLHGQVRACAGAVGLSCFLCLERGQRMVKCGAMHQLTLFAHPPVGIRKIAT